MKFTYLILQKARREIQNHLERTRKMRVYIRQKIFVIAEFNIEAIDFGNFSIQT